MILAGPSGSGKPHLAARLRWPVLQLDDFYRDLDEPGMPHSRLGIVDWDDPASWRSVDAVGTIAELCASGTAEGLFGPHILADAVAHRCDPMTLHEARRLLTSLGSR